MIFLFRNMVEFYQVSFLYLLIWSWFSALINVFFFFLNVSLFMRQRQTEHEWGRDRERGRHRIQSRFQALSCQHRAWHGVCEPRIMTWAEVRGLTNWATQVPLVFVFKAWTPTYPVKNLDISTGNGVSAAFPHQKKSLWLLISAQVMIVPFVS